MLPVIVIKYILESEAMSNVIDFSNVITLLRTKLLHLPNDPFPSCSENISEIGWLVFITIL